MSFRPDHVEAARPGLWSSPFAHVATFFVHADLLRKRAAWLQCREAGVMLEQDGPAMEPGEGYM